MPCNLSCKKKHYYKLNSLTVNVLYSFNVVAQLIFQPIIKIN